MIRLMRPEDLPAMKALWADVYVPEGNGSTWPTPIDADGSAWIAEQDGAVAAMLSALPVTIQQYKGAYLYGLAVQERYRGQGLEEALIEGVCEALGQSGADFVCTMPESTPQRRLFEQQGFALAFARRTVKKPLRRNLWSWAEFDAVPAKMLDALRQKLCPAALGLDAQAMQHRVGQLYGAGATVVSNDSGYGVYLRLGSCLNFIELLAQNDRAANCLLEAAREREVVAESALVSVAAGSELFIGEGNTALYGMIRYLGDTFPVDQTYLGLVMGL